jgi:hypothetical protein
VLIIPSSWGSQLGGHLHAIRYQVAGDFSPTSLAGGGYDQRIRESFSPPFNPSFWDGVGFPLNVGPCARPWRRKRPNAMRVSGARPGTLTPSQSPSKTYVQRYSWYCIGYCYLLMMNNTSYIYCIYKTGLTWRSKSRREMDGGCHTARTRHRKKCFFNHA